ncbi:hypothetical protein AB1Y20_005024 [Prymnesium parvum]|uniref:SGNH hydrolase-type esterase domain-containing protein n=1 Tax=Prymnesium parvum TaxID=97485 RepID=A0AB34J450_PRYPA|mmetsp:Transcript_1388/g.3584  ORF Transcript_1388/g.3584 Transcript_1388/m.3584 type:complete len:135 (+) Transcript_1388:186-590(+)
MAVAGLPPFSCYPLNVSAFRRALVLHGDDRLLRVMRKARRQPITIVTIGRSAAIGSGAHNGYKFSTRISPPSTERFPEFLVRHYHPAHGHHPNLTFVNLGVSGTNSFSRATGAGLGDVTRLSPDLVLWDYSANS